MTAAAEAIEAASQVPTSWTALAWLTITALAGVVALLFALWRKSTESQRESLAEQLAEARKEIDALKAQALLREERHSAEKSTWLERMHGGIDRAADAVEQSRDAVVELRRRLP